MRELKFRVWDVFKKKYLPEDCYAIISHGLINNAFGVMIKDFEEYREGEYFYPEFQVLEISTGILDENMIELFENDIVEDISHSDWIFSVSWNDDLKGYYMPNLFDEEYYIPMSDVTFRILGNIHENPELLTKQK